MKIGLALGSGGAKGYAALGILKGFIEEKIPVDFISGTSIGAFIGAVYSEGNLNNLINESNKIKFHQIPSLLTPTISKKGFFSGKNVKSLLSRLVKTKNIEDLSIPLFIHTTDINNSKLVILDSGDLLTAVRASISIPGLFTPIEFDNKILVDGAFLDPVPTSILKSKGADIIVAIDLLTGSSMNQFYNIGSFKNKNVFDIIQRSSVITQTKLINYSFEKNPPDIIICPDVSEINTLDFHKRDLGIKIGYDEFKKKLPDLKALINKF